MWNTKHILLLVMAVLILVPMLLFVSGVIPGSPVTVPLLGHPPRQPTHIEDMKAYITPDDPVVQQQLNQILNSWWRWAYSDYEAIRQWIGVNIRYVSDQQAHGVREYWQLPRETLELRTGDCEDFAILLCTFLRAHGYSAERVYVVCGSDGDILHGYVAEWRDTKGWAMMEPQIDIWNEYFFGSEWWVGHYKVLFSFNDQYYYEGMPPPPTEEIPEIPVIIGKPLPPPSGQIVIQLPPSEHASVTIHPSPLPDFGITVLPSPGSPGGVDVVVDPFPTNNTNVEVVVQPSPDGESVVIELTWSEVK